MTATMAFFTPCSRRISQALALLLVLLLAWPALAAEIRLSNAEGIERDGRYLLDARYVVVIDAVHENALLSGVPLTFAVEFTLTQPRWYWAYRRLADWFDPSARIEYRLSYHALTRQYRVSVGSLYQGFDTLSDALRSLGVVRDWQVFERGPLTKRLDSRIVGELSMRLDTAKLPKPMQLSFLGDAEWQLESDTTRVEFPDSK